MPPPEHSQRPDPRIWPDASPGERLTRRIAAAARAFADAARGMTSSGVFAVDGVHYRRLSGPRVAEIVRGRFDGYADFAVTFPDGERLRIRATRDRVFHDLLDDPRDDPVAWLAAVAEPFIRPGARVIVLGAGTGALTRGLADAVGPSGAITALEADGPSVIYAAARYPGDNIAHERGDHAGLDAEPDGCAEAVILTPLAAAVDPDLVWRLLAEEGVLIAAAHHAPSPAWLESVSASPVPRAAPPAAGDAGPAGKPSPDRPDRRVTVVRRSPPA